MSVTAERLVRKFKVSGATLDDPVPGGSIEQVRTLLSAAFPEVTTADIEGPIRRGNALVYEFHRATGTKGANNDSGRF